MKFAIDVMGSDKGSAVFVSAISKFLADYPDVRLLLFGKPEELETLTANPRIEIIAAKEVIAMDDGLLAIKRKKDASMIRMLEALAASRVDGALSAGSTAALLSESLQRIARIEGIERPCFIATMPAREHRRFHLLDMGANVDCTPDNLAQFAVLGTCYARAMTSIQEPKVALLNIGAEATKGDRLHREAYLALVAMPNIRFIGNIEGRDLFNGEADVIVSDGLGGNLTLKAIEGTAAFAMEMLKKSITKSVVTLAAGLLLKRSLRRMKSELDYSQYGGALLIGLEKPVIKAHGSSNETAVYQALVQLHTLIKNDTIEMIRKEML